MEGKSGEMDKWAKLYHYLEGLVVVVVDQVIRLKIM